MKRRSRSGNNNNNSNSTNNTLQSKRNTFILFSNCRAFQDRIVFVYVGWCWLTIDRKIARKIRRRKKAQKTEKLENYRQTNITK